MSKELIDLNPDLLKLQNEGYEVSIVNGHLVVDNVPYLNSDKVICYGKLIDPLNLLSPTKVSRPANHVIYFEGQHPCDNYGVFLNSISHQSINRDHAVNLRSNHSFSNKPTHGYQDYYEKFTRYIEILSNYAKSIDSKVTAQTYKVVETSNIDSVFVYSDTNSTRSGVSKIVNKLDNMKIAIVGLGGTGSYILDFLAKTTVKEIHLYDGDALLQHNAFRCPGAVKKADLESKMSKVDYYCMQYSNIRRNIIGHSEFINAENFTILKKFDSVFLAIDGGNMKDLIVDYLIDNNIWFVDTGLGLEIVDDKIDGMVKIVSSGERSKEDLKKRIVSSTDVENLYSTNIQIVELNALAASIAVIKWKQKFGIYKESISNDTFVFTVEWGNLSSESI